MYDFYRVEKNWLEADGTCNHEPDSWDFDNLEDAREKFDCIDVRDEFLREREQSVKPSKFDKSVCKSLYGIVVDENGYEEYSEVEGADCVQFGNAEYMKAEEVKRLNDVYNDYDVEIDFDAARNIMDVDIVEMLLNENWFETNQEFFDAYCEAHFENYGEAWELNKPNHAW